MYSGTSRFSGLDHKIGCIPFYMNTFESCCEFIRAFMYRLSHEVEVAMEFITRGAKRQGR